MMSKLKHLQKKIMRDQKDIMRAQIAHHGEKPSRIWTAINKEKKPRDLIPCLKILGPEPLQYERSSERMAELAQNYHESLQHDGINDTSERDRELQIENALTFIPRCQMLEELEKTQLSWEVKEQQTKKALSISKNNLATGMDGCPYKLWKELKDRHVKRTQEGKPSFNIVRTLTLLFHNIQMNGAHEEVNFALGWICPIYKKKDRTEISNYRPIILLNTNYKILTKVLAIQLFDEINSLVHQDQTGFIPGRCIYDNIRLVSTIINYMELTKTDGAIMALNQEKAYNRIRHNYL